MKFFSTAVLSTLALFSTLANGQAVTPSIPAFPSGVTPSLQVGQGITVRLVLPINLGVIESGVAFGIAPCQSGCPAPLSTLGTPLYQGTYVPIAHANGVLYQEYNVTVAVSNDFPKGTNIPARLGLVRLWFAGSTSQNPHALVNTSLAVTVTNP